MTLAILCPGQGQQHARMLDLLVEDPDATAVLDTAASALGVDPRAWLREPAAITRNRIAQPLICVAQLAVWQALRKRLPSPLAFAGYSVGELSSYACADALDVRELCLLVQARARAMDDACGADPGRLAAVRGLRKRDLDALCTGRDAWPAIIVDASTCVIGGRTDAIKAIAEAARALGAHVRCLSVGVPSHTPLLAAAVPAFRAALEASGLRAPSVAVLAGIDATLVTRRDEAIRVLSQQVAETIDWSRGMQALRERGCRVFLELGPGAALSQMIRDRFPDLEARSIEDFRSLDGALAWARARVT